MDLVVELQRTGYRLAYALMRGVCWVARPRLSGVKCVLRDGRGHVLLVRHSYGPRVWELPGGMSRRREPPLATARREMAEELGLDDDGWTELGVIHGRSMNRRDTIHVFGLELEAVAPTLALQRAELVGSIWCEPDRLPPALGFYAARILEALDGGLPRPDPDAGSA